METLKHTYHTKGRQINVWAGQNWDGEFSICYNTPNGYPRRKEFANAKECIKAFNRMTDNKVLI